MRVSIAFDGGGKNPGPSACGAVVYDEHGKELAAWGNLLGEATNNIAEYEGLLLGLRMAHTLEATDLHILGDSQLVIRQLRGEWKVKDPTLAKLRKKAVAALVQFDSYTLGWVPRGQNTAADAQVRKALGVPDKAKRTDWKRLAGDLADALSEGLRCDWIYPPELGRAKNEQTAIREYAEDNLDRYFEVVG